MSLHSVGPTPDNPWQQVLRKLHVDQSPSARPKPWVGVDLGPAVSGWLYRLILGLIGLGCAALVVTSVFQWVLIGLLLVLIMIRPSGMVPAILVLLLGIFFTVSGGSPLSWQPLLLLFGSHLLVVLSASIGDLPLTGLFELRVLAAPMRRFVIIQAAAQLLALAAGWLSERSISSPGLGILAGLGVAVLAWMLLGRLSRTLRH